jgi:hypothetical protein
MAEQRKRIGALETWHTRAKREWRAAAGSVGATVWLCPKCGYWPDSYANLPAHSCGDCGEQWASTKDDPEALPLTVRVTDYGYEMVSVGTAGVLGTPHQPSSPQGTADPIKEGRDMNRPDEQALFSYGAPLHPTRYGPDCVPQTPTASPVSPIKEGCAPMGWSR